MSPNLVWFTPGTSQSLDSSAQSTLQYYNNKKLLKKALRYHCKSWYNHLETLYSLPDMYLQSPCIG